MKKMIILAMLSIMACMLTGCIGQDKTDVKTAIINENEQITEEDNSSLNTKSDKDEQNSDNQEVTEASAGAEDNIQENEDKGDTVIRYDDYVFYILQGRLFQNDLSKGENEEISDMVSGKLWIYKKQLYYAGKTDLYQYNPKTKETTVIYEGDKDHNVTLLAFDSRKGIAYITDSSFANAVETELCACDVNSKTFQSINKMNYIENVILNDGKIVYNGSANIAGTGNQSADVSGADMENANSGTDTDNTDASGTNAESTEYVSTFPNVLYVYENANNQKAIYTAENGNVRLLGIQGNWYYIFDYYTPGSIGDLNGTIKRINKNTEQVEDIVKSDNFSLENFDITDKGIYYNNKMREFVGEELGKEKNGIPQNIEDYVIYDNIAYYIKKNSTEKASLWNMDLDTKETTELCNSISTDSKVDIYDIKKINNTIYFTAMKYTDTETIGWRDNVPVYTNYQYYSYEINSNKLTQLQDIKADN